MINPLKTHSTPIKTPKNPAENSKESGSMGYITVAGDLIGDFTAVQGGLCLPCLWCAPGPRFFDEDMQEFSRKTRRKPQENGG